MESTREFPMRLPLQRAARLIVATAGDDRSTLSHAIQGTLCTALHHIYEHSA